jgi:hypothetical protein
LVNRRFTKRMWVLAAGLLLGLAGCQPAGTLALAPMRAALEVSPSWTASPAQNPALPSPTLEATRTLTPAPVFYEPAGCWQPPEDYSRVRINDSTLNTRTFAMLQQAARLYGGEIDVAGKAILQGSYNSNSPDSRGGGAVNISVNRPNSSYVLYTEIEPLIRALRTVGFAAWLRQQDETGLGTGIYIHAIAIGDDELSPAAQDELTGPAGYLRGNDGLPISSGDPGRDRHGGPLICRWMLDAGYADLRTPTPVPPAGPAWQERLRQAALAYEADYPEDAERIARSLHFLDGQNESAGNVCGPLAAAILRDAGLLPAQVGPVQELKSYWVARPSGNGRPWSLFSERDYDVFRFTTPLAEFDFKAWPLQPADFVYAYARGRGFEHMFIVTEVDAQGRAYTVTNQYQAWGNPLWGTMLIQRYLLYDPHTPGAGIIYNEWSNPHLGLTGQNGFEVLRKRGLEAGSRYAYLVRPGDTLPDLAVRFGATPESIRQANPGLELAHLQVGQALTIPIPAYAPEKKQD